jgi:hypothetical protein
MATRLSPTEPNLDATPVSGPHRTGGSALVWLIAMVLLLLCGVNFKPIESIRTVQDHLHAVAQDPEKQAGGGEAWHGLTYLNLMLRHLPLIGVIAAVLLMVGGVLGGGLGLPGLFRDPPERDTQAELQRRKKKGYVYSRGGQTAFWGAFGATFVIAIVWTSIFFSELVENLALFDASHFKQAAEGAGRLLSSDFRSHGDILFFLLLTATPFLVLLLVAEWFHAPAPGMDREGEERVWEFLHACAGVFAGVVLVVAMNWLGRYTHPVAETYCKPIYERLSHLHFGVPFSLFAIDESATENVDPAIKLAVLTSLAQFILFVALAFAVTPMLIARRLSPGLGICMLLGIGVNLVAGIGALSTLGQAVVVLSLIGVIVWANGRPYKYRFPGMADYYEKNNRVTVHDLEKLLSRSPSDIGLLNNRAVLDRWRDHTGQKKPRLILVATTGGAYRASFWTTVVLEELAKRLGPEFYRHIRLFTGASGGMVGAGYFVAAMTESGPPAEDFTTLLRDESGLDSLTPVVRRLLTGDLPRTFWPSHQSLDRGIELEKQWTTLGKSFQELSQGEKEGWRPSIIVSPMVVESGRRLLISNLDLSRLSECRPLDPAKVTGPSAAAEAARLYSRPAVEFFRLFPKALPEFSLQTAVRMNATFPLASPAVSLPFCPPRRVVDAGYYDNYGVDLATSWIYEHQDWIRENTSGVALIQIRAYPSEDDVISYFGAARGERSLTDRVKDRFICSFQGITSPLAGVLSSREWSMRFRNATQVRIIDDLLNGKGEGKRDFFQTFIFENFTDFAMNWFLSDEDVQGMRRSIGAHVEQDARPAGAAGHELGARSDTKAARVARKVCQDANQVQKEKLAHWFQLQDSGHAEGLT